MYNVSKISRWAAVCAVALFAAACSTPKPAPTPPAATPAPQPVQSSIVPGSEQDLQTNVGDTVHFAFDRYDIQDTDKATLQRQATWLNRYPAVHVTIQGNCDERGTREYNLALGARRANAVKEYLVSLGVSMGRIDTISYGKEKPVCAESTEACWARNRRGVTVVSGGPSS